jgi:hypothetical protein
MQIKNVVSVVLLLFVAASVVYLIAGESLSRNEQGQSSLPATAAEESVTIPEKSVESPRQPAQVAKKPAAGRHKLVAYYFHRIQRCETCLAMEAYAEEALREGLSSAFDSGELEWQAVNIEEPQNEHFVEEYELTASALVMVLLEDGERKDWKNLGRVWELVGDELQYKAYVEAEALAMLEPAS